MLETLDGPINISTLSLTEPLGVDPLVFNPGKYITGDNWESIKVAMDDTRLDTMQDLTNNYHRLERAAYLSVLLPEKIKDLPLNKLAIWDRTKNQIDYILGDFGGRTDQRFLIGLYNSAIGLMTNGIVFFPEHASDIRNLYSRLKRTLSAKGYDNDTLTFSSQRDTIAADLSIISPGYQKFTEPDSLKQYLEYLEENKRTAEFIEMAADFKLTFPDQPLNISKRMWDQTKKWLDGSNPDIWSVVRGLYHIKILTAEEVKITDQGLELIMPKPQTELNLVTPALPETRKF